jgi:DNA sulfur modification protein DndE
METIRLSQQAKDQLSRIKRWSGLKHWNVICRWAFALSLSEPSNPPNAKIVADSSVEMTWKVFGGPYQELYMALLKARCERDGLGTSAETLAHQLRLHLHRGISYMAGDKRLRDIGALMRLVVDLPQPSAEASGSRN